MRPFSYRQILTLGVQYRVGIATTLSRESRISRETVVRSLNTGEGAVQTVSET